MEALKFGIVLDLFHDLVERLKSLIFEEAVQHLQFDAEDELKKLTSKLLIIQELSNDVDPTINNYWKCWLDGVNEVLYDAEDLVADIVGTSRTSGTVLTEKILSFFRRRDMAQQIRHLLLRSEDIINGLGFRNSTNWRAQQYRPLGFSHLPNPFEVVGRREDIEKIIAMLLEEKLSIVSINGMGGLGKTTLAQAVKDDRKIKDNFCIVWISVSGEFDLKRTCEFVLAGSLEYDYSFSAERIQNSFDNLYKGRSILFVLDDLQEVKGSDWNSFCHYFLCSSGSKILLTTSNLKVTSVTHATPYHLKLFSDKDCKALIMERASDFNMLPNRQFSHSDYTAGEIAKKCKGLPLAANILGLHLSSKLDFDDGVTLSKRDICELREFKEEIFPSFRLNYPSHLNKCLAYCSLFPCDYHFKKENLVQLWMAEGFVQPRGKTSLEDIGFEYFDELLWRVFQLTHPDSQEIPVTYKMHAFIHKFAEFLASGICIRLTKVDWSFSFHGSKVRHLSLQWDRIKGLSVKEIEKCDRLRTLLLLNEKRTKIAQIPYSFFQKLVRLRVLDLSNSNIDELPESLGRLKHLRYLGASWTPIVRLPKSTSDLHGLKILKLRSCLKLLELPKEIKNLTNLMHLDVDKEQLIRCMPASIGSLSYLRTLPAFKVGKKEGYRITELKSMNDLRGSLCLSNLENVKDCTEAREAMMCKKDYIKRLELEWSNCRNGSKARDILDGLEPHRHLLELQVINYGGSSFPAWLTSPLHKLVSIHLQNCQQSEVLPSLGQLPFLKTLHIEGLHHVKYVNYCFCGEGESGTFLSLETLNIQDMMQLTMWDTMPNNSMPQLRELLIDDCPNLFLIQSLSHMTSLQTLEINGCTMLRSLPELPASIQSLIITESDMLRQRCQPEEGPDWSIITAIPRVEIDYETLIPRG